MGDLAEQIAVEIDGAFDELRPEVTVIVAPAEACREFAEAAFPDSSPTVDGLLDDLALGGAPRSEAVVHGRQLLSETVPWGEVVVLIGHPASITLTTGVEVGAGEGLICAAAGDGFHVLARTMPNDWARMA